ncbi:MAG: hypothetical protein IJT16_01145 [Lachnospiraceae bacterium]|nr:hypothetical protein [Lachnospiraceae bacterium]
MQEWILDYLAGFRWEFFLAQTVTVILLFLLGLFFIWLCLGKADLFLVLLAYPTGLSLYVISGMLLLIGRLGLSVRHLAIVLLLFLVTAFAWRRFETHFITARIQRFVNPGQPFAHPVQTEDAPGQQKKGMGAGRLLFVAGIVLLVAVISCSGFLPISLSNDSMYYYSLYPRALATYGELRKQYNVFLTDVGLGSALIGTLPYFFGFNETFGIQWAFNIDFLIFYVYMIRRRTKSIYSVIFSFLLLVTAMPFFILSRWAMSNFYFMEYLFICVLTAEELLSEEADEREQVPRNEGLGERIVLSVLTVALSTLRMEGMVFVIFVVFAYAFPGGRREGSGSSGVLWIANLIVLPCILIHGLYFYRIFIQMEIIAAYTFLSKGKAALELLVLVLLYVFLISKVKITNVFKAAKTGQSGLVYRLITDRDTTQLVWKMVLVMLTLVNLVLLFLDRALYIENLKAFGRNLTHQSGWGVFPIVVLGAVVLILVCRLLNRRQDQTLLPASESESTSKGPSPAMSYMEFIVLGYLLITLAVSFARGDPMQESFGDSGNRVLMQIAPLLVFALSERVDEIL